MMATSCLCCRHARCWKCIGRAALCCNITCPLGFDRRRLRNVSDFWTRMPRASLILFGKLLAMRKRRVTRRVVSKSDAQCESFQEDDDVVDGHGGRADWETSCGGLQGAGAMPSWVCGSLADSLRRVSVCLEALRKPCGSLAKAGHDRKEGRDARRQGRTPEDGTPSRCKTPWSRQSVSRREGSRKEITEIL